MNLRLARVLACVITWLLASGALAQAKGNTPEYRQLVDQAVEEFQRGNWDEASGLFEQAHQLNPNARTLRGMGLAAFEGRRYVAALKHLEAALNEANNPLTETQRGEVRATLERAQRYVAKLALTVEPPETVVTINGAPIAHSGAAVETIVMLDPGVVELRATASGYQAESRQLRMVSGEQQTLQLQLSSASSGLSAGAGTTPPPVVAASSTSSLSIWKWVTAGAAVVGFGVAIPAFLVSSSAADDWNNDPTCRNIEDPEVAEGPCGDRRDDFERMETVGIIATVAGSVFAVTSITLFVIDGMSDGESSTASAGTTACGAGLGSVSCKVAF